MSDVKSPVVGKGADGQVTSVVLDVHVDADSPLAVQIPEGVEYIESPLAVFDAPKAPAAKPAKK